MRVAATALLALGLVLATPAAAEPQASLPDIEDEVMCPICGTLLQLSDAPQAERERSLHPRPDRTRPEQGANQGRPR